MANPIYKIARDGKIIGDYDPSQVEGLLHQGEIKPTDSYWTAGMTEWSSVSELTPQKLRALKTVATPKVVEETSSQTSAHTKKGLAIKHYVLIGVIVLIAGVGAEMIIDEIRIARVVSAFNQHKGQRIEELRARLKTEEEKDGPKLVEELGHDDTYGERLTEKQAIEIGQMLIRRKLKVPATAKFGETNVRIADSYNGAETDYLVMGELTSQSSPEAPMFKKQWGIVLTTKNAAETPKPKNLEELFKWYLTFGHEYVKDEYYTEIGGGPAIYWMTNHPEDRPSYNRDR